MLQITLNELHKRKKEGDARARRANLATRRGLEWLVNLFNIHAHNHSTDPLLIAIAMATTLAILKSESVDLKSEAWPAIEELKKKLLARESGPPEPVPAPKRDGAERGRKDAVRAADVRSELLQVKREIEEYYTREKGKMDAWEHVLQNARLADLIRARPRSREQLRDWVRSLNSYPRNRGIMEDQVERFGIDILDCLGSDSRNYG
jgi:hypothetical protein